MKSKVFGHRTPLAPDKIMTSSYSDKDFFNALRYIEECVEKGLLVIFYSADCVYYSVYEFIGIDEITIKMYKSGVQIIEVDGAPCQSYCICGTIVRYRGIEIKTKEAIR